MLIQIIKEGEKNFSLLVKGSVRGREDLRDPIVDLGRLKPPRAGWKGLRLDSAVWAIQEKMGLLMWWEEGENEKDFAFVMESRNGMRFDEGVPSPRVDEGWGGKIYLTPFNETPVKWFFLLLDFDKQ